MKNKLYNNNGFTLFDVIIVGAVIAMLTALTYPTVSEFMVMKSEGEEEQEQLQLLNMMKAMSKAEGVLPITGDVNVYGARVRAYGDVPLADIVEDSFGNPRYYIGVEASERFKDASLNIQYTFIYSTGSDGCWGEREDCAPADILANVQAILGDNPANYKSRYSNITIPRGDYLTAYTNYKEKLSVYKQTVARLNKLVSALTEYGKLKYYEGVAENIDPNFIYFPPSDGPDVALFYNGARADTINETSETDIYGAGGSDVLLNDDSDVDMDVKMNRRLGMIALTRMLGLPDKYCCNAMSKFTHDGTEYEEAFFYYSNPLARIDPENDLCGPEITAVTDRKLPPRITVEFDYCGKVNP